MSRYIDRLTAQSKDALWEDGERGKAIEEPTRTRVVDSDRFDKMAYEDIMRQAPPLDEERLGMGVDYPTGAEAYEDLFNLLYQADPRIADADTMTPAFRGNHLILSAFRAHPTFEELRHDSAQDMYSTAYTQLALTPPLREALDALNNAQAAQQALAEALSAVEQEQAEEQAQGGAGEGSGDEEQSEAVQNLQQALDDVQRAEKDLQGAGIELVKKAAEAQDEVDEEASAASLFGIGPGQLSRMSFEERRELAKRLHRTRTAHLAKLVGAWRMYGEAERRRKITHAPSEIHDFVLGNDLNRLAPGEINDLATPELEDQFWLRYAKHGLLTKEVRGPARAGHGPIIVVCDESYSMDAELDSDGNTREAWSKAVSLALSDQARRGNRDFTYIGFGGHGETYAKHFPKGGSRIDDVIDFVTHFFKGGTVFDAPLRMALNIVKASAKSEARPDVVFITDGNGSIDPDFLEEWHTTLEKLDGRCFGIQVGEESASKLKTIAHKVMQITKLNANPEGMRDLFRTI